MPFDQTKANGVLSDWQNAKDYRQRNWDTLFQQCKDVVWPDSTDFTVTREPGSPLVELIYDSTACDANEKFANGIHAAVANPFEQWFAIRSQDDLDNSTPESLAWLEIVTDIITDCYSHPLANQKQSLHEYFKGLGCLGTSTVCQEWDDDIDNPVFSSIPLSNIWLEEDNKGRVNKVFRRIQWTKNQAIEEFGEENLPPRLLNKDIKGDGDKWDFIHAVQPRKNRNPKGKSSLDMKFESIWIFIGSTLPGSGAGSPSASEEPYVCKESGYRTMPYHAGRWSKISGEKYGRSCAMNALPNIRITNQMEKVGLRAAQKVVDPPLMAPHDAFMSQLDMTPGAVNYYDSSAGLPTDAFRPIQSGVNIQDHQLILQSKKDAINQMFYADLGNIPFKKERQTTAEIQQQQDALLRNIAPLVGEQEAELLGPMIMRTFDLLTFWKKIPPYPDNLKGKKLKIVYVSRAARAIKTGKLAILKSFIAETVVPMIQLAPEAKDALDVDAVIRESADLGNVTRKIFRTPEAIAAIRKDRAAQQAQQQQLQAAESASTSLKNVGQAGQASPDLLGIGQN